MEQWDLYVKESCPYMSANVYAKESLYVAENSGKSSEESTYFVQSAMLILLSLSICVYELKKAP